MQVSSADPAADELDAQLAGRGAEVEAPVDVLVAEAAAVVDAAATALDRLRVAVEERTPAGWRTVLDVDVRAGVDEAHARFLAAGFDDPSAQARTVAYGTMLGPVGPAALAGSIATGRSWHRWRTRRSAQSSRGSWQR